ncbi:MAG: phenylalanine--tRNA ligase subunit alpha, partial [Chloroflexi bacterium]|nr:phenylalanine--tRNA ligase subunit alpha [Chloroflexota bacterium]
MTTAGASLVQELQAIREQALQELDAASSPQAVEEWRVAYLGRKGRLSLALRSVATLPVEERRTAGSLGNELKQLLEERLAGRQQALREQELARAARERLDVTLPGRPVTLGRLHPTTQIVREICAAFVSLGFQVVEGPEVEWDRYNFEMLNIPKDHPARDMWNTLWIDYVDEKGERPMLLRTHTSPMQARVMERMKPPVRVVVPGKCYRYEATDATHEWHFFQIEGLAVDEGITFADLKGTLYE